MAKNKNSKVIRILSLWGVAILYLIFSVWRSTYWGINSDYSNLVLEANDIVGGNIFLKGWNLTGISFTTTDLPYFIVGALFKGISCGGYYIATALMRTALVIASYLLVKDIFWDKNKILNALIFISFPMLPCVFTLEVLRAHTGSFILCFIALWLLIDGIRKSAFSKKVIAIYIILVAFAVNGDPISILLCVGPVCLWAGILWLQNRLDNKKTIFYIGINAAAVVLGTIIDKLYFLIGGANKNSFLSSKLFLSLDKLQDHTILYIRSLLLMNDANFESQQLISVNTAFYAINTVAVIIFFILVIYNIACFIAGKKHDTTTVIVGFGFIIMSAVFIITNISVDVSSSRYIGFFVAFMGIVFIRNYNLFAPVNNKRFSYVTLSLCILILLGRGYRTYKEDKRLSTTQNIITETLINNNLHEGYATFWNASSVTVISGNDVKIRAISSDDQRMSMFNWFCKDEWYKEEAHFVVVGEGDIYGVTPKNIEKLLGTPDRIIVIPEITEDIYVYDKDISAYLFDGLHDGKITPTEWYGTEPISSDNPNERVISPTGVLWGPYSQADEGTYTITFYGKDLDGLEFDIFSNEKGAISTPTAFDSDTYTTTVTLPCDVDDLEVRIFNNTDKEATIYYMEME